MRPSTVISFSLYALTLSTRNVFASPVHPTEQIGNTGSEDNSAYIDASESSFNDPTTSYDEYGLPFLPRAGSLGVPLGDERNDIGPSLGTDDDGAIHFDPLSVDQTEDPPSPSVDTSFQNPQNEQTGISDHLVKNAQPALINGDLSSTPIHLDVKDLIANGVGPLGSVGSVANKMSVQSAMGLAGGNLHIPGGSISGIAQEGPTSGTINLVNDGTETTLNTISKAPVAGKTVKKATDTLTH